MHYAENFQCTNKDDYVYFRFDGRLEIESEFDTLLLGSLDENGKISKSKRYGQGFLEEYTDLFMGYPNDGRYENYKPIEIFAVSITILFPTLSHSTTVTCFQSLYFHF